MSYDIIVIGAGPAGLCFARSLAGSGLRIALIERQEEAALAAPADDGREIAITHHSQRLMRELGLWDRLRAEDVGTLREAKVIDGNDEGGLVFRDTRPRAEQLGWMVSNHAIRSTAFAEAKACADVDIVTGARVASLTVGAAGAEVTLERGDTLQAQLLVAADSRFSDARRAVGISADMHDFGKTMLVLRMRHSIPHAQTAWEWFGFGQTLAVLPLHDPNTSSIVVTLPPDAMRALLDRDDAALGAEMAARFQQRLGAMEVAGPRCAYPLVGVYARRFVAERFALIGDAAVGMHPVTAHGFNFGLLGQDTLARALRGALAAGRPFWERDVLRGYERRHRLDTRPLYVATQMLASLYTDDRAPARMLRKLALRAGARVAPFRRLVVSGLVSETRGVPLPLRVLRPRTAA